MTDRRWANQNYANCFFLFSFFFDHKAKENISLQPQICLTKFYALSYSLVGVMSSILFSAKGWRLSHAIYPFFMQCYHNTGIWSSHPFFYFLGSHLLHVYSCIECLVLYSTRLPFSLIFIQSCIFKAFFKCTTLPLIHYYGTIYCLSQLFLH